MFYIPVENYPKLEKKFTKIKNKGGTINLVKHEPVVLAITDSGRADLDIKRDTPAWIRSLKHKFYPIEVEGSYEIPGWRFIATIEHTPNGNIIRNITDEKIPDRYYNSSPECEHCHKIRGRKDTYLVQNTDTGEFKQVGKSCLRDYTGGLDAGIAAQIAEWVRDPESMLDDELGFTGGGSVYFDANRLQRVAYNYVKENGYSKDPGYINALVDAYVADTGKSATDQEMKALNDWVLNLDTRSNDYYRNAFIAWNLEDLEYRHLRLITSLINSYFKDVEKQKQRQIAQQSAEASQYVGEVGQKVSLTVASYRVLYYKTFTHGRYTDETPVFKIIGADGNTYVWATNTDFDEGDTIVATIKSHSEYNGEKQTVITRGKVKSSNGHVEESFKVEDYFKLFLEEE